MRKLASLTANLRHNLSIVSSLDELKTGLRHTLEGILDTKINIELEDYNKELYEAASGPEKAILYLARLSDTTNPLSQEGSLEPTSLTNISLPDFHSNNPLVSIAISTRLPITSKHGYLGRVFVRLTYRSFESIYIEDMMEIIAEEIAIHWSRLDLTAEQKIADYKMLMETTRGNIMERFLSNSLTQKFQNNMTMEQNLENVLTPHPARAALLQADIRGYSNLSAKLSPIETVKILQKYYKNVVDQAQVVAQIKLIGDCIFLFIEKGHGTDEYSPTDLALKIASTLVAETNKQNDIRVKEGEDPLFFGIAIHYGDVVLGNLSSDYCIDYTVIGPNVNQVARMEELTKHEEIKSRIGINGVVISNEAAATLQKYKHLPLKTIDLEAVGRKIRSFETVCSVSYLTAEDVLLIESDIILDQLKSAS